LSYGERLREMRKQAGFTQRLLARNVGIDFTYLSKMENGVVASPSETVIRKIVRELAVQTKHPDENGLANEFITLAGRFPSNLARSIGHSPEALGYLNKLSTADWHKTGLAPVGRIRHAEVSGDFSHISRGTPATWAVDAPPLAEARPSPRIDANGRSGVPESGRKIGTLRKSDVFSCLNREQCVELSQLAVELRVRSGQFVFRQGDEREKLYVVAEGTAKVLKHSPSGKDFIVAFRGPGELLGSLTLVSGRRRGSSVQAATDMWLLAIRCDEFLSFLSQYPESGFNILRKMLVLVGNLREIAQTGQVRTALERADHRLLFALFELSSRFGPTIPVTREELAQMAGIAPETAVRITNRLKAKGVVLPLRGKMVILDQAKLSMMVGDSRQS